MRHSINCDCRQLSGVTKKKKSHRSLFRKIIKGSSALRKKIFKDSPKCFINCISECCKTVLDKKIEVSEEVQDTLVKYRKDLCYLADKKIPAKKKRVFLIKQSGGFLALVLPTLFSVLLNIIGNSF